ncbi:MAG: cupin domain-containing protein [Oscillochloridaceae bacterium umkhey_bin13]
MNTTATLTTGSTLQVVTDLIRILVTPSQNQGAYLLFTSRTAPGAGVPPHRHDQEDEAFVVLRGRYGFMRDEAELVLGPGDTIFVPRGTLHGFQNIGTSEAELLIITSPGHLHEAFFSDLGIPLAPGATERVAPPALAEVVAAATRHGIELMPPPAS